MIIIPKIKKVFICPHCGEHAVSVIFEKSHKKARVICNSCRINNEFKTNSLSEPIDVFGDFVDWCSNIPEDKIYIKVEKKKFGGIVTFIDEEEKPEEENEIKGFTIKKEKKVEEVFKDPGYLEF